MPLRRSLLSSPRTCALSVLLPSCSLACLAWLHLALSRIAGDRLVPGYAEVEEVEQTNIL